MERLNRSSLPSSTFTPHTLPLVLPTIQARHCSVYRVLTSELRVSWATSTSKCVPHTIAPECTLTGNIRPLDVTSFERHRKISENLVGTTSTSSPSSVLIHVSEVRPPPSSSLSYTYSRGMKSVQHGADLGSWFGHPSAKEDDTEMYGLARHMTAYLMYVSLSLHTLPP